MQSSSTNLAESYIVAALAFCLSSSKTGRIISMSNEVEEFKQLLVSSKKILVTSHISPDPDAVCSTLLLGTALKTNYPDKNTEMVLEEHPAKALDFLDGYQQIKFQLLQ